MVKREFFSSLRFKFGVIIILIEIVALSITGIIYIQQFSNQIDERVLSRAQIPGNLIAKGKLDYDVVRDPEQLIELVGEEPVDAMVISITHIVFYSLNTQYEALNVSEIPGLKLEWFSTEITNTLIFSENVNGNNFITVITPVLALPGSKPYYFTYLRISTNQAVLEKNYIILLFVIGSLACITLSTVIILISFRKLLLMRINRVDHILREVQSGNLSIRLDEPLSDDEMGVLQRRVNVMIEELQKYRENLEDLVKIRTEQLENTNIELINTQDELIHKEKLAILGRLAGGIAHELRSPLAGIKASVYFIKMQSKNEDPKVKVSLSLIDDEIEYSEKIIESLLNFAQKGELNLSSIDINDILIDALNYISKPENIDVIHHMSENMPKIKVDPNLIIQVFNNIILNSYQAMPNGGKLIIESGISNSEMIKISFIDTGVGISEENLEKIFQPLFSTKTRGIGFGLANSKEIVDSHGGRITVKSKVGYGSTFIVELPIMKDIENKKK